MYVLFYKRLMLDKKAKIHADMFNNNSHYVRMQLGAVDWEHKSKRFTVPESALSKVMMHDMGNITKRVHKGCGPAPGGTHLELRPERA